MDNPWEPVIRKFQDRPDRDRITETQAEQLRREFPELPTDYIDFLTRVGFGDLDVLQFYSGPVPAGDIYPQHEQTTNIILICDDTQGYCFGFDTIDHFAVVELNPRGDVTPSGHQSFLDLVTSYFGKENL